MIAEACQTLKRNREQYLANRSTQSLVNILSDRGGKLAGAGIPLPQIRFGKCGENRLFARDFAARPRQFFRATHARKLSRAARPGIRRRETARRSGRDSRRAETKPRRDCQRAGISSPHRGGQHSESGADEHRFRPAHALGAICEMRGRLGIFAAPVRPFDLRSGRQTRRVPGNRRMARRK